MILLNFKYLKFKIDIVIYKGIFILILSCYVKLSCSAQNIVRINYKDSTDIIFNASPTKWIKQKKDSFPDINNSFIYKRNYPKLPLITENFSFNKKRELSYKIISSKDTCLPASITNCHGLIKLKNIHKELNTDSIFNKDVFFPFKKVQFNKEYNYMGTYNKLLEISPFQFNPKKKHLVYYKHLHIRVYHKQQSLKTQSITPIKRHKTMLIIAPKKFHNTLRSFILWKNKIGIYTILEDSDILTNSTILYNKIKSTHLNTKLNFILLVGDINKTRSIDSKYGLSDNKLACLEGSDPYMDAHIGRFPAKDTIQLKNIIIKSIQYEKAIYFTTNFLGIASDSENIGYENKTDFEHINYISEQLNNINYNTTIITTKNKKSISNIINKGCGLISYAGHGNEYMLKTNTYNLDSIDNLRNTEDHPFFIDVACLNGKFDIETCFAEKLMIATTNNKPSGVLAVLASSIEQAWIPPMYGQKLIIEKIIESATNKYEYTLGEMVSFALREIINKYGETGIETALTWNLFADPSVYFRPSTPINMNITHDSIFNIRKQEFKIKAPKNSFISISSDSEIISSKFAINKTDTLNSLFEKQIDSVEICVSNNGYKTYIKKIPVSFDGGAYYNISNFEIEDNNSCIEYNENIIIRPEIKNLGNIKGENLELKIISHDKCIDVVTQKQNCDFINAQSTQIFNGFDIYIKTGSEDLKWASITFEILDASGQKNNFHVKFQIKKDNTLINSININKKDVVDNKFVFIKDTLDIFVLLNNKGNAPSNSHNTKIRCSSAYVEILSDTIVTKNINPLSTDSVLFKIKFNPDILIGEKIICEIINNNETSEKISLTARKNNNIQISDGNEIISQYPFYNYYKNNKSQFLILENELEKITIIDSIALLINSAPSNNKHNKFNNFSIKLINTTENNFSSKFINTDKYKYEIHNIKLENTEEWFKLKTNEFALLKKHNLLVEISWSGNEYCTPYQDNYTVVGNKTNFISSIFSFSDSGKNSVAQNTSNYRPLFKIITKNKEAKKRVFKLETKQGITIKQYRLTIGTKTIESDNNGFVDLPLSNGKYIVEVESDGNIIFHDSIFLDDNMENIALESIITNVNYTIQNKTIYYIKPYLYTNIKSNKYNIKIYDTLGRMVLSIKSYQQNNKAYINLPKGIYICKVNKIFVSKFLIY